MADYLRGFSKPDKSYILGRYDEYKSIEPHITSDLEKIAKDQGVSLAGLEYRLKTLESFARKLKSYPHGMKNIAKTVNRSYDILRYTYILDEKKFVTSYNAIKKTLEQKGFTIDRVKNSWFNGSGYKGINTVLEKDGFLFELQYHTKTSYHVKTNLTHELYEKIRSGTLSKVQEQDLTEKMIGISDTIPTPEDIGRIKK